MEADAFLVIDVLRATTTIATLFARGLADLLVFDSIEAARKRARAEGRILLGEVGGLPPKDFDYGNSPAEAATLELKGQGAALFTTNGTRALCASAGRGEVVAASFAECLGGGALGGGLRAGGCSCAPGTRGAGGSPWRTSPRPRDSSNSSRRRVRGWNSATRRAWRQGRPATRTRSRPIFPGARTGARGWWRVPTMLAV